MLPKLHRLTEKNDFQLVLKKGNLHQGKYLGISVYPSTEPTKVGIIISNKVSNSSVERNRIRRIIRAVIYSQIVGTHGQKIIFLAKKQAANIDRSSLEQDTKILFDKYAKTNS